MRALHTWALPTAPFTSHKERQYILNTFLIYGKWPLSISNHSLHVCPYVDWNLLQDDAHLFSGLDTKGGSSQKLTFQGIEEMALNYSWMERPSDTNLSPNLAVNHLLDMSHAAIIQASKQEERMVFLIRNRSYKMLHWEISQRKLIEEINGNFNQYRTVTLWKCHEQGNIKV